MKRLIPLSIPFAKWSMTAIISSITVAQVATIINAFITFVSFTVALFIVVLLVKFLPTTTTAVSWSAISRTLHSSLWPTVLGADSRSSQTEGVIVSTLTRLGTVTTILVAAAGIILPLGLSDGPIVRGNFRLLKGTYVPDDSPLALSTTPNRGSFVHGRQCGGLTPATCPGNDDPLTIALPPSIIEIFNSTPHGPFAMQFRRFYQDEKVNCSVGYEASAEMFVLRNDTFFAEGLIIDMTTEHPGIGLWNQTIPNELPTGGTWSQDILWIEPETQCVDTNLTVDYFIASGPHAEIKEFNITDHGGFYNLAHDPPPPLNRDGQHIDLHEHAYKGAAYSNLYAMLYFNATRNTSFEGATYRLDGFDLRLGLTYLDLQKISALPLSYLNHSADDITQISCQGFGGGDTANITNVHVNCGVFLGPPLRTDGGDNRVYDIGSKWTQGIHACSSATRASIQTVTFSSNSTGVRDLLISRDTNRLDVLWATEKTDLYIRDLDLFWGRVDDRYENHPSLWTTRSDRFYVPAGFSAILPGFSPGQPQTAQSKAWAVAYGANSIIDNTQDYSGEHDYGLRVKFQNLILANPIHGNTQIRNLVFTDFLANNIMGTQTNDTLWVADHLKTVSYDFRYAIPGFLLLTIWIPSFLLTSLFFLTRTVTFEYMKEVFNQTSVGRVVVGPSAFRILPQAGSAPQMPIPHHYTEATVGDAGVSGGGVHQKKSDWADTVGKTPVTLSINDPFLTTRNFAEENDKLMKGHSNHA